MRFCEREQVTINAINGVLVGFLEMGEYAPVLAGHIMVAMKKLIRLYPEKLATSYSFELLLSMAIEQTLGQHGSLDSTTPDDKSRQLLRVKKAVWLIVNYIRGSFISKGDRKKDTRMDILPTPSQVIRREPNRPVEPTVFDSTNPCFERIKKIQIAAREMRRTAVANQEIIDILPDRCLPTEVGPNLVDKLLLTVGEQYQLSGAELTLILTVQIINIIQFYPSFGMVIGLYRLEEFLSLKIVLVIKQTLQKEMNPVDIVNEENLFFLIRMCLILETDLSAALERVIKDASQRDQDAEDPHTLMAEALRLNSQARDLEEQALTRLHRHSDYQIEKKQRRYH